MEGWIWMFRLLPWHFESQCLGGCSGPGGCDKMKNWDVGQACLARRMNGPGKPGLVE